MTGIQSCCVALNAENTDSAAALDLLGPNEALTASDCDMLLTGYAGR
jgi:hypothetical protein